MSTSRGTVLAKQTYYDTGIMDWAAWDASLQTSAVNIGAVTLDGVGVSGGRLNVEEPLVSTRVAYDANGNVVYVGKAAAGSAPSAAAWRLTQYAYDGNGNLTSVGWADGNTSYDNSWDSRATYSYS